jgi:murein DD-endopeptidase MepM/ murein hydrolase activator NlpD
MLLSCVLLAVFTIPQAKAASGSSPLKISHPEQTHPGAGFALFITSSIPLGGAQVTWQERTQWVPAQRQKAQWFVLALLGSHLDAKTGEFPLRVTLATPGGAMEVVRQIAIMPITYPEQRLTLPPALVTPPEEVRQRLQREEEEIRNVLSRVSFPQYWLPPLIRPVPGAVTSPFGVRRLLNNKPRAPHRGVDFRGKEGTPVKAWSAGQVVLTADHYFGGKSVYLDHGAGVLTSYLHLSRILVNPGDIVAAGDLIGQVGKTGRSTAPHLHFGLYAWGHWVNPLSLGEVPGPDE